MNDSSAIKIFGIVVVYYPDLNKLESNILSYINQIDKLIIWNNSQHATDLTGIVKRLNAESKILIFENNKNMGIGFPLNQACEYAFENGYKWCLTMDQDSGFSDESFFSIFKKNITENLGVISPVHTKDDFNADFKCPVDTDIVMTSGNIISLDAWYKAGKFKEDFFIDEIDHEFCLKLKLHQFSIKCIPSVLLNHELGVMKVVKSLKGQNTVISVHSPVRIYYIVRNGLYVMNGYNKYFPQLITKRRKQFVFLFYSIIRFENKKFKKLLFAFLGFIDYLKNQYGEFDSKNYWFLKQLKLKKSK